MSTVSSLGRLALGLTLIAIVGCSSAPKKPAWFLSPPDDPAFYVASSSGESMREQMAIQKAKTLAQTDISQQIENRLGNLTKMFQEEVGTGENSELLESFSSATKTVTKNTLRGVKTKEVFTLQKKNGSYTAYVLMLLPKADVAQQMMQDVKSKEILYNRFRASQAHADLEKELEAFDKAQ